MRHILTNLVLFIFAVYTSFSQINNDRDNTFLADTIPSDMVTRTVFVNDNPSPGNVFISTSMLNKKNYLYVLDTAAYPVKYKSIPTSYDFKLQPNGLFSYSELAGAYNSESNAKQMVMNSNLEIIDTVHCSNGYDTDVHDFIILPNGHYMLVAYDPLPYDFSGEVEGGNPGGILTGAVLQEFDKDKKPVFQWRSNDFLDYKDTYANLNTKEVDYFHINSAKQDWDGNYILSSRHMSQVLKINRHTGEIMWRLGGKSNEYTFTNEYEENSPVYFSYQHDVHRLNNGNIIMFDNGNQHDSVYSRAAEYKLDETNKSAELVWEYRHEPDLSGSAQGSVQRLKNGNTLVNWGSFINPSKIDVTEVTPDKKVVWEMGMPRGTTTYRAYKYEDDPCKETAKVRITEVAEGNEYKFKDKNGNTGISILFQKISAFFYNYCESAAYPCAPMNPVFDEPAPIVFPLRWEVKEYQIGESQLEITFDLNNFDIYFPGEKLLIYVRPKAGEGKFESLSSVYDKASRTVTATSDTYGEYIIGMPDTMMVPPKPALILPYDKAIVGVQKETLLKVSPKGIVKDCEVVVSEKNDFSGEPVFTKIHDEAEFLFPGAVAGKTYYWRARTSNLAGTSQWSDTRSFYADTPFVRVSIPNGGEYFYGDTIIRWKDNIGDSIKIELLRNGESYKNIANAAILPTGGLLWRIPKDIAVDSVYQIKISSIKDPGLFDLSDNYFSISLPTDVEQYPTLKSEVKVYPNPTNGPINIDIRESLIQIKEFTVFDILGVRIFEAKIDERYSSNSSFEFDLSFLQNGVYFYQLNSNNGVQHGKLILNK